MLNVEHLCSLTKKPPDKSKGFLINMAATGFYPNKCRDSRPDKYRDDAVPFVRQAAD
jgi:hypothetical protein